MRLDVLVPRLAFIVFRIPMRGYEQQLTALIDEADTSSESP